MNYYEELGLRPNASPDEIRQAYRSLAKVLHPDQQPDPKLRRLADGQMKRLNQIHGTLIDPSLRREYDAMLEQALIVARPAALVPVRKWPRFHIRDAALVAAGIAVTLIWWQAAYQPEGAAPPAADVSRPAPAESAKTVSRSRSPTHRSTSRLRPVAAPAQRSEGEAGLSILEPPLIGVVDAAAPAFAAIVPPAPAAAEPVAPSADAPAMQNLPRFGGTWVYVRPRLPSSQTTEYSAEYVETLISEEGTHLRGRYRARYDVADRPISGEVVFRFEGEAGKSAVALPWTGAGGAEGEVRLVLLSANSMKLEWVATSLGTQLGLASGSAVLTRRREE